MKPVSTGWLAAYITIGIVTVARFAAANRLVGQRHDHFHVGPNEIAHQLIEAIPVAVRVSVFDLEVAAFDPAVLA